MYQSNFPKSLNALLLLLVSTSVAANKADEPKAEHHKHHHHKSEHHHHHHKHHHMESSDVKFHLGALTFTPGGFFAGEGLWRSRDEQADIGSTFNNIPLRILPQSQMKEFRMSARQSRLSLLVEGKYRPTILSGYVETDFLGNGTGNSNESNSYDMRIRHAYAAVDHKDTGWHALAGQNWSLLTTNSKGITPRHEVIPPTIDAQYVVGFAWKRQAQFRLTKDFCEKVWAAVSVENPQTTFGSVAVPGNLLITNAIAGTQTLPGISANNAATAITGANTFSTNNFPDVIAKLALDYNIFNRDLHGEVFGLYRNFYDRVAATSLGLAVGANRLDTDVSNKNKAGGGFGAGLIMDLWPELISFQGNIMFGRGIGSYASGSMPDVTINVDGSLAPIHEIFYMLGATMHATKALDVYVYGGMEKQRSKTFEVAGAFFGQGNPGANNFGCDIESGPAAECVNAAATRKLWQITGGVWDKLCAGNAGTLKAGLQYSYTYKEIFQGSNGGTTAFFGDATSDNIVMASFRYYPYERPTHPKRTKN